MKRIGLIVAGLVLIICTNVNAQYTFRPLDPSPADLVYYPLNAANTGTTPKIKVIYSRPQKKGREIFGVTEAYGKVWRAGANESTEIQFFVPVKVGDKTIPAGTYSIYALPEKDKWTIFVNSGINRWGINRDGTSTRDPAKDVGSVVVPVKVLNAEVEALSMTFTERADGANLVIGWDKTAVEVPLLFSK